MGLLHLPPNVLYHGSLDLDKPLIHVPPRQGSVDFGRELDVLSLGAVHAQDVLHVLKVEFLDAFEALFEMGLHLGGVFSLRQYLQQLLAGQEEEPREAQSLGLQVGVESSLDDLKVAVAVLELLQVGTVLRYFDHLLPARDVHHR